MLKLGLSNHKAPWYVINPQRAGQIKRKNGLSAYGSTTCVTCPKALNCALIDLGGRLFVRMDFNLPFCSRGMGEVATETERRRVRRVP